MKRILSIILSLFTVLLAFGQSSEINSIVNQILDNNSELKAWRELATAEKNEKSMQTSLPDLEIGYNRLWGSPHAIGNRNDFSITQSVDFATLTGAKRGSLRLDRAITECELAIKERDLALHVRQCCAEAIYYNCLVGELEQRVEYGEALHNAQKRLLDSGEGTILEYNNAQLNLLLAQGKLNSARAKYEESIKYLTYLNGGKEIKIAFDTFPQVELPQDFHDWFESVKESIPEINLAQMEREFEKSALSVSKMSSLPTISAGYMSEKVVDEHFQGLTLGVSLPLWSAKRSINKAKSSYFATELLEQSTEQRMENQLSTLYINARGLEQSLESYREALSSANNNALLLKEALTQGNISLVEYYEGTYIYYEVKEQELDMELAYLNALIQLMYIVY